MKRFALNTLAAITAASLSLGATAKELDTGAIAADVEILRGILASAAGSEGKRRPGWFDGDHVAAWYLARQGVVFRIDTEPLRERGGVFRHIEILGDAMEPQLELAEEAMERAMEALSEHGMDVDAPDASETPEAPAFAYRFSTEDGARDAAAEAEQKALREAGKAMREKSRALREQARALHELQRQKAEAGKLEAQRKQVEQLKAELKASRDKQRELIRGQKAKAEAAWAGELAKLEDKLVTALCNYGGGLKSIPKDEHVTLILRNAVQAEGERQDLIQVFSRKDLSDCQGERLSAKELKARSLRYAY